MPVGTLHGRECYSLSHFTGDYKFAIASDDTSELWLSTDNDPQNLRKIACVGCIDQVCLLVCVVCTVYVCTARGV